MGEKSRVVLFAAAALLVGCDVYRDDPAQQVEDYQTCIEAGMDTYQTIYGEIRCKAPGGAHG